MTDGFRNLALIVWAFCAINSGGFAKAQEVSIREEVHKATPQLLIVQNRVPSSFVRRKIHHKGKALKEKYNSTQNKEKMPKNAESDRNERTNKEKNGIQGYPIIPVYHSDSF